MQKGAGTGGFGERSLSGSGVRRFSGLITSEILNFWSPLTTIFERMVDGLPGAMVSVCVAFDPVDQR